MLQKQRDSTAKYEEKNKQKVHVFIQTRLFLKTKINSFFC